MAGGNGNSNNQNDESRGNNDDSHPEEEEEEDDNIDVDDIPYGPVFFPTIQQFLSMNPMEYIAQHVNPIAEQYGICKIVPPKEWQDDIKSYSQIPAVAVVAAQHETDTVRSSNIKCGDATEPMMSSSSSLTHHRKWK